MNVTISDVKARQILDSRGNPTVEADVFLSDGNVGRAAVPSGASTGAHEAIELRDGTSEYGGKSVNRAVENVNTEIRNAIIGLSPFDQAEIDQTLCDLDATSDKSRLGANAILSVSLAVAKAAAESKGLALYQYIGEISWTPEEKWSLPMPMMNVMNGGQHALGATDIQEYMIIPVGAANFPDAMRMGADVFHQLAKILKSEDYPTTVGDEGGYAPRVRGGNIEPISLIMRAIEAAGYAPGRDIALALDVAASEFYKDGTYQLETEDRSLSAAEMIEMYKQIKSDYPVISIEDGLDEEDWDNWQSLTMEVGGDTQLVGDDLLVTNTERLQRAIDSKSANAILIKPNQIGTLTETIEAVKLAKSAGWRTVMSHRSGETEDVTIAHLAVGLGTDQIKTGSLSRSERIAKYNEILRIGEANPSLNLARPFGGA
ncbi:phosphopyruvate hydratase [Candidatus Saccharibacteria bacterium 32-50-13]|nr:MAG: phosphopyruvate hydratase [Candidatus Saccharibacteria bacterium 32-50-13]